MQRGDNMHEIKKGDIVSRNSYGNDIIFSVVRIMKNETRIALLKGIDVRIEADAPLTDLQIVSREEQIKREKELEQRILTMIEKEKKSKDNRRKEIIHTGRILHLDGDRKYSEKSKMYYRKMGLNAVVRNVPEYKQSLVINKLLMIYNPDILVITGHDGMIKNNAVNDIFNYRNSRHFIETIKQARKFEKVSKKKLVIFAGACQSYFEALISAGANFASSPARILIDFLDPLIVAKNVAETDNMKYVTIDDFVDELRDGKKGVNGFGAIGKRNVIIL